MPDSEQRWHIARNNKKLGPFVWTHIQQMAAGGMLQLTDMLLKDGSQRWQELSEFTAPGHNGVASGSLPGLFNPAEQRQQLALWDYKDHLLTVLRKLPPKGFAIFGAPCKGAPREASC